VITFDLGELKEELNELRVEMNAPDFWDDQEKARKKSKLANRKEEKIETYRELSEELEDIDVLYQLASEEENKEELEELQARMDRLSDRMDSFQLQLYMDGDFDDRNCYLGINAGAGGTDAQDWAGMLLRM